MPSYDYQCSDCKYVWEELLTIENMDIPLTRECPNCCLNVENNIIRHCFSPPIGDPVRLGLIKPPENFREVLRKIQNNNPAHSFVRDR